MNHLYRVCVHYEDTDMGGVVYHANFLKFVERARSRWVADLGIDQMAMRAAGTVFAVRRIEADFLRPARFGDALEVHTWVRAVSAARLVLDQRVLRAGEALFTARVTVACMSADGRPQRLPAVLRALPAAPG